MKSLSIINAVVFILIVAWIVACIAIHSVSSFSVAHEIVVNKIINEDAIAGMIKGTGGISGKLMYAVYMASILVVVNSIVAWMAHRQKNKFVG